MRVILRLKQGPAVRKKRRKNQQAALAASAILTPAAVMATALALWRIGVDMAIAGAFPFSDGLFSHWQVWFVVAGVLQASSIGLSRYGNAEADSVPAKGAPPAIQGK